MALVVKAAGTHVRRLHAHQQNREHWEFYIRTVIADARRTHRYELLRAAQRVLQEASAAPSIAAYEKQYRITLNSQQPDPPVSLPPNSNTGVNPGQLVLDIMGVKDVSRET